MPEAATVAELRIARIALILLVTLAVLGALLYGLSADVHQRIWRDIAERPTGPMSFRFLLQPIMASIAAFRDGVKDAQIGRSPYLWTMLTRPSQATSGLREGLVSTGRIILLGIGMDAIYQAIVLKTFYPGEMALIAILLAFVPYILLRGPFARLARWWRSHSSTGLNP